MSTSDRFSGITFEGNPLNEIVDQESGRDLHKAITDSAPRILRRSVGGSKHTANHSRSKTLHGALVYCVDQKWQKIRISGCVFSWAEKASRGWTNSGHSIFGVVELTEKGDEARCHHCGEGFADVSKHLEGNNVDVREHRIVHGINLKHSLNSEVLIQARRLRLNPIRCKGFKAPSAAVLAGSLAARNEVASKRRAASGRAAKSPGLENLKERCETQTIFHLKELALYVGHTPTLHELNLYTHEGANPLSPARLRDMFGTVANAMLRADLAPHSSHVNLGWRSATVHSDDELLIRLMTFRSIRGRWPKVREFNTPHGLTAYVTYQRRFGGIANAIAKAESRLQA